MRVTGALVGAWWGKGWECERTCKVRELCWVVGDDVGALSAQWDDNMGSGCGRDS